MLGVRCWMFSLATPYAVAYLAIPPAIAAALTQDALSKLRCHLRRETDPHRDTLTQAQSSSHYRITIAAAGLRRIAMHLRGHHTPGQLTGIAQHGFCGVRI